MARKPAPAEGEPDTRTAILAAGETVFAKLGFTHTTIGDIARQAHVSRPTVYSYFTSKEDIFRELAIAVRDEFLQLQEIDAALSADEIIQRTLADYLATWVRHLGLLTVINHEALSNKEMRQLWKDIHDWPNRRNARFIDRLATRGEAKPVLPSITIAEAITAVTRRFAEQEPATPAARGELASQLLVIYRNLAGMSAPHAPATATEREAGWYA